MSFLGLFPSEEEKQAQAAAKESKKQAKESAKVPQKEPKKKAKEQEWADVNEQVKFVIHGGKVQCPFAMPPIADIIVTSNTVMLQDKPFATIKDKDGKVNFNFTGVCTHPSQQKPSSPPPPCKAVIKLGKWANYSETMINNDNALLVKSTIKCNISGQDLKIIHSGQKAELTEVKPIMKDDNLQMRIEDAYWIDETGVERRELTVDYPVTLYVVLKDDMPDKPDEVYFTLEDQDDDGWWQKVECKGKLMANNIAVVENFKINSTNQ